MRVYPLKITKTNYCIFYIFITTDKGCYGHLQMISACPREPNFNKPNYSNLKPYFKYSQLYANQIQAPMSATFMWVSSSSSSSINSSSNNNSRFSFVVAAAVATAAAIASVAVAAPNAAAQLLRMKMMISSYSSSAAADRRWRIPLPPPPPPRSAARTWRI